MTAASEAEYFAVPDPDDPDRMTYWRQTAYRLDTWPPRARYGPRLMKADIPSGLDYEARRDFMLGWYRDVATPWHDAVRAALHADPAGCSARFAAFTTRCCWCARRLTDAASKTYGVGPDCRSGWPDSALAAQAEAVGRAHAEAARHRAS